jgi:peptidoglycan-associated lipoprotein
MNKKLFVMIALTGLALMACSKKPKQELVQVDKAPAAKVVTPADSAKASESREDSLKNAALQAESLENVRLEGQRKALEDMMNRLMSEEIYFEFDKAVLSEKAKDLLSQAGDILAKEPKLWVEVEGHTDERGTEAYNMTLGGKRAQSVVDYLVNYGVATDRLKSISFGEEKPKTAGATEDVFAKNRRAAFNVKIKK